MLTETLPKLPGFDHAVCSLSDMGQLGVKLESAGFKVYCLGGGKKFSPASILKFRRIVKTEKPDLVATRLIHADIFGRLFGRLFGVKRIVCHLESVLDQPKYDKFFFVENITRSLVDHYVAVATPVKEKYLAKTDIASEKISVIPNGINLEKFTSLPGKPEARQTLGLAADDFLVGYVGRLKAERNHRTLLAAVARLNGSIPRLKVLLIGDGEEMANLKLQAEELGITDQIAFMGRRNDIPMLLASLDVFISPSFYEGMSVALIEAMAAGLPIVASDIPSNAELISNQKSGILIPPESEAAIADAMSELYRNARLRQTYGEATRIDAQKYSIVSCASRWAAIYANLFTD